MIDLILKPHGSYQYRWERDESGWNEVQTALGPYATYSPGDDEASLYFWGDTKIGVTITIFAKMDGEIDSARTDRGGHRHSHPREG